MKKLSLGLVGFLAVSFLSKMAFSQKWADLEFTVVLGGDVPEVVYVQPTDPKCGSGPKGIPSELLVVNPTNKGIANVLFYVDAKKSNLKPENIHPELAEVPATKPVLDNVKCQFVPHVMIMRAGQTLEVKNSDDTSHNAKMAFFENKEANPVIPSKASVDIKTIVEERTPTKVDCNVHSWMTAHVFVLSHPYAGVSNTEGKVTISKLPAGIPLEFKLWHENSNKLIQEVQVNGKTEKWEKAYKTITLKEGKNDLGTITIDRARFK
jgi:plastocyanin